MAFKPPAIVLIILLFAGCGVSVQPSEDERLLQVEFTQRDSLDRVINILGDYEVPITKNQLPLSNALKKEVSLKGYRGSMVYGRENGNPDKEVIAFVISFNAVTEGEHFYGTITPVPAVDKPIKSQPTGVNSEAEHKGTYYAFLVEGIGDPPDVPVEIVLRGSEDTQKLTIDPDKHTLPGNYALHIKENELNPISTEGPSSLYAQFGTDGNDFTDSDKLIHVFHLPSDSTGDSVGGGVVNPGLRSGVSYKGGSFDYYLLSME